MKKLLSTTQPILNAVLWKMLWRSLIPILLILQSSVEGAFIVNTSNKPTVVAVGRDVVLECQLIPAAAPEEMEVRWFQNGWQRIVHMYRKGKDEPDEQMKEYFGRTELFHNEFGKGNVSLLLRNVTVKDNGMFRCFVISKAQDAEGAVELKVGSFDWEVGMALPTQTVRMRNVKHVLSWAPLSKGRVTTKSNDTSETSTECASEGVGRQPAVKIAGYEGNGIELVCASDEWFPEPRIEWWNSNGEKFTGVSEKPVEDARGLLKVGSSIVVSHNADNTYKCVVTNLLLQKEREAILQISGDVFPTVSGWLVAFWVIFIVLLAVCLLLFYFCRKYRGQRHQIRKLMMRPAINEYEALNAKFNQACASAEKEKNELLKQIENEKQAAKLECEKLLHLIEWDKMLRCAVSVTLDPETANGHLEVSPDRLSVKDGGGWRNVTENPKRFERYPFVVASEGFRAGTHYWEVEVGDSNNWDLGVARASAQRKGRVELSEENGYWVMGRYWEKYKVKNTELTLDRKPARVGVFLNLKEGLLSFHDAETKTQLYAFQTHFGEEGEEIFPFFCPWRSQEPLKITPVTPED
ncbi:butyrophilin subfamily 1 member A1-like isoform X1 [Hemiscyllium ocellatum]|uniref:butyrophilin subfamily 1 member A1-like isoform X1 n=1 Tax=Hemiscyllium ocellatum TaxID=170820 RepID=UPI002966B46B|nr:butyrophilin subfamily 1 member A1-like isoform X1 [Hemiscyllium ocellatum]XP_060706494.1 butyrophilin subfamily 1 member A1-like isoform X1 [Hemiscyllium ocellatum]